MSLVITSNSWWNQPPTPCQTIDVLGVSVVVKRDDLNHHTVQGNKLRKLKYNLQQAQNQNANTVVTFGGAYSNHLVATAYAANALGIKSLGFVRGDELASQSSKWSDTLNECDQLEMQLQFISRSDYRLKTKSKVIAATIDELDQPYIIPEGGSNQLALQGVAELIAELEHQVDEPTHIICPVGTGGTFAGLVKGVASSKWDCQVLGVGVLKGLHDVKNEVNQWLKGLKNLPEHHLLEQFCGAGYAKSTQEMVTFSLGFEQKTGIQLDKIYNTKSFYALAQLIKSNQITATQRPLIIHTGGLQGGVS